MPAKLPYEEFYNRVERQENGCLIWTGPRAGGDIPERAYGLWGGRQYAHREAYEREYGPIPPGKEILHSCDTQLCVEPTHLRVGTHVENEQDKIKRGHRKGLTIEQREEIIRRRAAGERGTDLAREFGVGREAVYKLSRGWAEFHMPKVS